MRTVKDRDGEFVGIVNMPEEVRRPRYRASAFYYPDPNSHRYETVTCEHAHTTLRAAAKCAEHLLRARRKAQKSLQPGSGQR